jgi:NADPH-dependent 2,4-dienoyl-CoA reductase/sulfur reductase-like enzyme
VPSTDWLRDSGIDISDGVLCAPTCHAMTYAGQVLDDVVAAGDVARWPNLRFDNVPRRVEHWIHAIDMGEAAADALLAGPERAKRFTPVPRFWTEQFGVRIQVEGIPALGTELTILEGTIGTSGYVGGFTRSNGNGHDDQLVGVVAVDNPVALQSYHEGIGSALSDFPL